MKWGVAVLEMGERGDVSGNGGNGSCLSGNGREEAFWRNPDETLADFMMVQILDIMCTVKKFPWLTWRGLSRGFADSYMVTPA